MSSSYNKDQLYRQVIMDHYRNPRNKGLVDDEGYVCVHHNNPSCGDDITVQTKVENGIVKDVKHDGSGCSICCSSASMMSEVMIGETVKEAIKISENFENMLLKKEFDEDVLEEAISLEGVSNLPPRIKCASISWKAFTESLDEE